MITVKIILGPKRKINTYLWHIQGRQKGLPSCLLQVPFHGLDKVCKYLASKHFFYFVFLYTKVPHKPKISYLGNAILSVPAKEHPRHTEKKLQSSAMFGFKLILIFKWVSFYDANAHFFEVVQNAELLSLNDDFSSQTSGRTLLLCTLSVFPKTKLALRFISIHQHQKSFWRLRNNLRK
jgi:hypothetical protein